MSNVFSRRLQQIKQAAPWLLVAPFWLISRFPFKIQLILGRVLGFGLYAMAKKIRYCTAKNIEHCYPDLSRQQQKNRVRQSCIELGITILETFKVWFSFVDSLSANKVAVIGAEHLRDALAQEKGIILVTCHFGSMDLNGALLSKMDFQGRTFNTTYRKPSAPLADKFLQSVRRKISNKLLPIQNLRGIVRELKNNNIVWIAPDIEVKDKTAVFVTFQGVNAATSTMISRLSRMTGALVVPVRHFRTSNAPTYQLEFYPPLSNFPTEDVVADTQTINHCLEKMMAEYPERYWWCIKRFKKRPEGESKIY
jgi:KDO2-lipid IV(A) lauroyltransferase